MHNDLGPPVALLAALLMSLAAALPATQEAGAGAQPAPEREFPGLALLPEGTGRNQALRYCQSCHSLHIVAQQRLSREDWDETLDWMLEEGMPELPPVTRKTILDYLAKELGP